MKSSIHQACLECLQNLTDRRLAQSARRMSIALEGHGLQIPFFDQIYCATPNRITDSQGRPPTEAVALVLGRYILQYPPDSIPQGPQITFRELIGAGPLVSSFASNTNKLIAGTFSTNWTALQNRCRQMGGRPQAIPTGHDLSVCFSALPQVPLYLQFNAADDLFPSQATLLFQASAEQYLDMQTLFILGTYLAGRLVSQRPSN
jgi:hypothetical protein